jgi:glutamate racemase
MTRGVPSADNGVPRRRRIGMFDSGLGGLTVLRALRSRLPDSDITYAADTAHLPYGDRPLDEVKGFATAIIQWLQTTDPSVIVIACGTTCSAFHVLGAPDACGVPMIPVVHAGAHAAARVMGADPVGVVATAATVHSGIFEDLIRRERPNVRVVSVAAPSLVPLIEAPDWDRVRLHEAISGYCAPLLAAGCATLVLGCTHYPLVRPVFEDIAGAAVRLVDPAEACAERAASTLAASAPGRGQLRFAVSGDPALFARSASRFFDLGDAVVERVEFTSPVA